MMDMSQALRDQGIDLKSSAPGRYYTMCPQCSAKRKGPHQRYKVLGVTVEHDGAHWGCNHCGWTGATGRANGRANGADPNVYYDYVDEDGELLFQKVRGPNKKFWQRKPDGSGGWMNKLGDTRKVIYRLPQVNEAIASGYTIVCVEGEKDADNLWKLGVPATCSPDGAAEPGKTPKWRPEYSEMLRGADLVVIGDNDAAGRAHVEATAKACTGVAATVRVIDLAKRWPACPKGGDVSDWIRAGHTREQFDAIIKQAPDASDEPIKFKLVSFDELESSSTTEYLVKGVFPRKGLAVVWGPPKCGKSFWVFTVMTHVALGREYRGRRVNRGEIVYLPLEGQAGFSKRRDALCQRYLEPGETVPAFRLCGASLDLIKDNRKLIADIQRQAANPACVVIDTLNRSLAGSESKDEDMAAYLRAADAVQQAFQCLVVIVHHCGVNQDRPRGHTSLTGAADVQISVKKDEQTKISTATVDLAKDMEEGAAFAFRLEQVELGLDQDGDPITSCVATAVEGEVTAGRPLSDKQQLAMEALTETILRCGRNAPPEYGLRDSTKIVTVEEWKTELYRRRVLDPNASNPSARFTELRQRLNRRSYLGTRDDYVWDAR